MPYRDADDAFATDVAFAAVVAPALGVAAFFAVEALAESFTGYCAGVVTALLAGASRGGSGRRAAMAGLAAAIAVVVIALVALGMASKGLLDTQE